MPITGAFEADYSAFIGPTKDATAELKNLQGQAATTTGAITNLEQATKTTATTTNTLTQSYKGFDSALQAAGINIGPQVRAIEEIGTAAGKGVTGLGLLGAAGLVVATAVEAWNIGRAIAGFFDLDTWISNTTASLFGWGDAAAQVAGAQQDSINLAFERTGVYATTAAQALELNTKWVNEHNKSAKEAAKAGAEWNRAMVELNSAGDTWRGTLEAMSRDDVEAIKYYLQAGVSQGALATAYDYTATQIKAVASALAAEKKAHEDTARVAKQMAEDKIAAQRLYDAELKDSYQKQIGLMADFAKASQQHYGLEGQIQILKDLAAAEQARTKATYDQMNSEKERMKLIEANNKRQTEIALEITKLEAQLMTQKQSGTLEAIKAQTAYNKAIGLDAYGALQVPQDALEVYRQKVATLNATLQPGIELTNKLKLAEQELQKGLLDEANATEAAANATRDHTKAKEESIALTAKQIGDKRANTSLGGGGNLAGGGDAAILALVNQGMSLADALKQTQWMRGLVGNNVSPLGARAAGGPVSAGGAYIVGERGPELFMPDAGGTIVPSLSSGGGNIQITINGSVLATQSELAALVQRAFMTAYRTGGNRLPV
jgi:hypothetical protein